MKANPSKFQTICISRNDTAINFQINNNINNNIQLFTSVEVNIRFYGPDLAIFTKAAGRGEYG